MSAPEPFANPSKRFHALLHLYHILTGLVKRPNINHSNKRWIIPARAGRIISGLPTPLQDFYGVGSFLRGICSAGSFLRGVACVFVGLLGRIIAGLPAPLQDFHGVGSFLRGVAALDHSCARGATAMFCGLLSQAGPLECPAVPGS